MTVKPFLAEMDKNHRQAFLELEKQIAESKIECLVATSKIQVQKYDDSKIIEMVSAINSKNKNFRDYINEKLHMTSVVIAMSLKSWVVFRDLMNLLTINNQYIDKMIETAGYIAFGGKPTIEDAEKLEKLLIEYRIIEDRCEKVKKDIENYESIMKGKQFDILDGFKEEK